MAFDPSTAAVLDAPGFDPSSATAVEAFDPSTAELHKGQERTFLQEAGDVLGTATEGVARGLLGPANLLLSKEQMQAPLASPETMKYMMPYAHITDAAAKAFPDSQAAQVAKGVTDSMTDAASGFTSPENLALLGIAPESKAAQRLVMGVFEGQALTGLPEQFDALKKAKTTAEKTRIIGGMILGTTLPIGGALLHAKVGEVPKVDELSSSTIPVEHPSDTQANPLPSELPAAVVVPENPISQTDQSISQQNGVPRPDSTKTSSEVNAPSVRLYHGASKGVGQAGRDFTTSLQYAQGYADKANGGGQVWYVDVPQGLLKTHDEYGQPMSRVLVPDEIANQAKPLEGPSVQEPPLANQQGEFPPKATEELPTAKVEVPLQSEPTGPMESQPTSTKSSVTDQERIMREIAPAVEAAKRDFGTVWDQAEAVAQSDPTAPQRLVESLKDNPRALTDQENALLLRRQIEVQNEHDAAVNAVNEAPDASTRQDAQARLERVRDDLQTVYDASKVAGTETGRGLAARKMLANNDYSLAKMEATTRAVVNNGKALSPNQAAEVRGLHERIKKAEAKLAGYEAQKEFNDALKQARAEARQTGFKPQSFLEQQAARARERIVARRGKLFTDPIGVTQIAHLADEAIIGASHIARGVTKFGDWSKQMVSELGDRIKPYLQALFSKAQEIHAQSARRTAMTPEERMASGLRGDKRTIQTRIQQIQEKTAAGDFTKPEKQPPRMDKEKANLLFEYQKAKEAYNRGLFEAKLKQQTVPRKVLRYGGEVINTARALMTSFDLSAVLRQGGFIALGHPIRALQSFPAMFRAFGSERAQHRINAEIMSRPNAPTYIKAKLFLVDESATSLSKMEEAYMSRWASKIPGVAGSQRAYVTFLNKLRADSFDAMAEGLARGGAATPEEARAIANYINVATGRGDMGAAAQAAVGLNTLFFAPRLVLSRFQLLAGQPMYRGSFRTRMLVAREYARFLAGAGVVYALGQSAGATVDTDHPTDPDFLKLKFGNTRVDVMTGLLQATVFSVREAEAIKRFVDQSKGKNPKYGSGGEVLARFLRTKLSPAFGGAVDVLSGKNVVGQPVTPQSVAGTLVVPMSVGDVYQAMKEQGVPKGAALGILSVFGAGLSTYKTKHH